ncbi:hypothetical protein ABXN37_15305 [Piscinibacter sakaiensis]|uniref:hypothetical protein n=1 Tax=Piscinibacter sakaiensis TaxID=1547922 RepID=UPI0037274A7D
MPLLRLRRALGVAALTHGDLLATSGDLDRARARWGQVEALMAAVPADGGDAADLLLRAHAQFRRGAVEEAQGVAAKLSAAGVRSPQLAALQRRIADARRVQFP